MGTGPENSLIPEEFLVQIRDKVNEWWNNIDNVPDLKASRDKAGQLMDELREAEEREGLAPEEVQGRLSEALKLQPELMPFIMPREQLVQQNAGKWTLEA